MLLTKILVMASWAACFSLSYYCLKRVVDMTDGVSAATLALLLGSVWTWLLVVFYPLNILLQLLSVKIMPLSVAGPCCAALGVVLTFAMGRFCFSEPAGAVKFAGAGLILAGVALLIGK